jgi:hypothetical protein
MNDTLNTETQQAAIELSVVVVENSMAINNTLAETKKVTGFYGTHYANAELDICGIVALVKDILRENEAVFSRGIENTELRAIGIAASMFTSDIVQAVNTRFASGGMRYKPQAVKNVLSTYGKLEIAKIQLTNAEDKPRPCSKPRAKWYLIQQKHS